MSQKIHTPEEEIDLGNFLNQIGKLFSKLFNFISGVLKYLYNILILTILFCKKHYLKLVTAAIIGIILGILIESFLPKTYKYEMIVEPKFDGAFQLNEKIKFYNQLIENKDFDIISTVFSIDKEDAKSIKSFNLEVVDEPIDVIERYDDFVKNKDSITIASTPFRKFSDKNFSFFNAKRFLVSIMLDKPTLKRSIEKELTTDLEKNQHLQNQKIKALERLQIKEDNIKKLISDLDSTRSSKNLIALTAAKNANTSTTDINLYDTKTSEDSYSDLFERYKEAYEDLNYLLLEKEKNNDIFKIITPLQPQGLSHKNLFYKKYVELPIVLVLITFIYLILKVFNSYLKNYSDKKNPNV